MKRGLNLIFAVFLIVAGLIVLPLPIPFGLIMIVIGLAILTKNSSASKNYLIALRSKNPNRSAQLNRIKRYMPEFVRKLIEETEPKT